MILKKITSQGIYYINDSGNEEYIDFKICNENWLAYRKRTEALSDDQMKDLTNKDRVIGQRDINKSICFIEFFTKPFVRFEFKNPEQIEEYRKLRDTIQLHGWVTYDLS